jgi:Tfp pilus assembly protein PilN
MSLLSRTATDAPGSTQGTQGADVAGRPGRPAKATAPRFPGLRRGSVATSSAVNLLSPWVLEELRVRRLRRRFVVAGVALLLVVAAAWSVLRLDLARAEEDLQADESVGGSLAAQIDTLGEVKLYVGNVLVRSVTVERIMERQIGYAAVLGGLDRALPPGATLTAVSVALPPNPETLPPGSPAAPAPALCPGPDPFGSVEVVGCVTISGSAASRADVSELVTSLGGSDLFIEPFITATTATTPRTEGSTEGGTTTVQFEGTLGLSAATYTQRFTDVAGGAGTGTGGTR